ncbi:hypothetical protein PTSG_11949 [Salpingoeca rosetta]|uniref:Uncharacterized protein n=1 Tax=Salpingoeca rosetta (strain ATCC 50818 / BSB-021) TaxID=946362 RepID=F2U3Y5_SALR5|nr:uncharacterized protein PTSG_11949 [Salpingoeca rosetta]EGD82329.1 hypothetical protein PTSG_11949 [Salpingoeca rosetta]|eukprot:XP_004996512.1 hypothetical protein PTSG_11949 [Salpingoeca rosetta]
MKKEQAAQGSICHKNYPPPRLSCKRLLNARPPKCSQFIQRGRPQESRLGMNVAEVDKEDKELVHGPEDMAERVCIHPHHTR